MMERAVDGERLSNGRRIEVDKKAPSIASLKARRMILLLNAGFCILAVLLTGFIN